MTPSTISAYLKTRHRASLADMALHFDADASAVRGILDLLIARGRVRAVDLGRCGDAGGCTCDRQQPVCVFEYLGREPSAGTK